MVVNLKLKSMEKIKIYKYQETPITFNIDNKCGTMVNATQMAKPFGKRTNDFLSSKSTNELINSLSVKTGISATGLVVVNQGGRNQGTWLHEDLALIFAQWLSPQFYLWCNDRIKELLLNGRPTLYHGQEKITEYCAPITVTIGENTLWTVEKDGTTYYRFRDILNAIGIYRKDKRSTYRERPYICWINDGSGNTLKRYVTEKGAQAFFEGIRKKNERLENFRKEFFKFIREGNNSGLPERFTKKTMGEADRKRMMDIIINTREEEDRKFLYDLLCSLAD